MSTVLFCAIAIVSIKWFWRSLEIIFPYWLLLCAKCYAEHSWRSLNLCISSSIMSLQRPLNVSQKSGNEVMGNERYCPLHATGSQNPNCSLMLSLFDLGMLVSYTCACQGLVPRGPLMLWKNWGMGVLIQISSTWVLISVADLKCSFLRWLLKWTTSRNRELHIGAYCGNV